jgi:hypothetical protein
MLQACPLREQQQHAQKYGECVSREWNAIHGSAKQYENC